MPEQVLPGWRGRCNACNKLVSLTPEGLLRWHVRKEAEKSMEDHGRDVAFSENRIVTPDAAKQAIINIGAEKAVVSLLLALGEKPEREGLKETPRRVVKMLQEMFKREEFEFTTFDANGASEMIVLTKIPVQSLCEHHMVPFIGEATVAYIPNGKIVGLSKLARAVHYHSRGLKTQEYITNNVADMIDGALHPQGVGVIIKARHMCMELRGAKVPGVMTTTSALRGAFMEARTRMEFLEHAR